MDAVELALPQAAAVSKLMGSEGLEVRRGVSVAKVDAGHSGIEIRPSVDVDACSLRDKIPAINAAEPALWKKMPNSGYFIPKDQPSSFYTAKGFEDFNSERKDGCVSLMTGLDSKQWHHRSGKVARSNSSGSKRSRMVQIEVSVDDSAVEDVKSYSTAIGSCAAKGVVAEKTQMPRQKNNANGKRGDKRTGRIPKSRCDTFTMKNGLVSFGTVAGGGNIPVYGSKSNIFDVTKHVDELPLNELLDGSYNCPSLAKDKGKGVEDSNEGFLNLVRKACSLLLLQSPFRAQNSAERDNNYNQKVSVGTVDAGASPPSRNDGGKGDHCSVNQPSTDKLNFEDESRGRPSTLPSPVELPVYSPKHILERLSLPPPKDLDSLLLDATKSASSSRNNTDLRLGKIVSHRTGLPPFPWSHNSTGHSKSSPDTVKLSASRTTCQGRWVKVENSLTPLKDSTGFLVDLKSLTYDHRLVPIENLESGPSGENITSSHVQLSSSEQVILSSSAASSAFQVPQGEHAVGLLAAAETLCEIAAHPLKQNSNGMMKLLKKPSQKTMKACKSKLNEKSHRILAAPKTSTCLDNVIKIGEGILPSKKLRLSMDEKTQDVSHTSLTAEGTMNWSTSRTIRSPPSKLFRDPLPETKICRTNTVKKSYMMPPPAQVTEKAFSSRQKLKEVVPMEWNPTAGKLD